jgi:hypothetical protein
MEKILKDGAKEIKDTIVETSKKTSEAINSRMKNPFVFSYLISFILFNWKPISIFFKSELDIYQIIDSIERNSFEYDPYKAYLYPLLIAFIYTFLLPFIEGFRSLILDLAENLKLYSTTIQINNFKKKQRLEIEKSDLTKRNSLSKTIITLEGKNKELENEIEVQSIKYQTSKIEMEGIIKQNKNFEKIQSENKSLIEKLTKELNQSQVSFNEYESKIRSVENLYRNAELNNEKLKDENLYLDSNYNNLRDDYNIKEQEINNRKLRSEYLAFRRSELYKLFIQFTNNENNEQGSSEGELNLLINNSLVKKVKNRKNSKVEYQLTDKGVFFYNESIRKR